MLSYNDIENILVKIFSAVEYFIVGDLILIFKFPTNQIKNKSTFIYDESYKKAIEGGLLSSDDIYKLIDERKLITDDEKQKLKKLKSQLEAQGVLLTKTTKVKANQDRIKTVISRLRGEIKHIENKRDSKLLLSADVKAEEERLFFIFSRCLYKDDDTLYWRTYEDALNDTNVNFRDQVLNGYIKFYRGMDTSIIREVARSNIWRIRYLNSMKTGEALFGVPTADYSSDQLNLAYWSNFYQNIYEMMPEDRPSDNVIEDDDALDAYMKSFYEDRLRESSIKRSESGKRYGGLSAFNSEEVIVTSSNDLYQDITYDEPREAKKLKDRTDIKKRAKRKAGR